MQLWSRVGFVVPLALALAGSSAFAQRDAEDWLDRCREDSRRSDRAKYCEVRELGMRADDRPLTVDPGQNGGAAVRAWDRDSIHVSARVQTHGGDDDEARDVARQVRIEVSRGLVRSDGPSMRRGTSWSVSYEILVPRRTDLRVDTHNGPIAVEGVSGRMELTAVNGPLTLDAVGGDVRARTTNGPLRVTLEGRRWEGAGLDAETTNGPAVLSIPENYSARLETGTVNGPMSIGFPITVQGRLRNRLTVDLGSGGPPVRVVTTNGPVVVRRQ
jgi:DUF4097 and DUF4098 domain-containing protein YvlB